MFCSDIKTLHISFFFFYSQEEQQKQRQQVALVKLGCTAKQI